MGPGLKVKFWGTRGMVSSPGAEQQKYGGNTPCIQILYKDHIIIIDTGFGVSNLGETLLPRLVKGEALTYHIFYTHFHWDHIQGLPFFQPTYFPHSTLNLYSPVRPELSHRNLDQLFDGSYSPFAGIDKMPSKINLVHLQGPVSIDTLRIDFCDTDHGNHAQAGENCESFAYRFKESVSRSQVAIVTDHEARIGDANAKVVRFAKHADLLIHDAQFDDNEYAERIGWGHSSIRQSLENALKIKARKVLLTHHDPGRTDQALDSLLAAYKANAQFREVDFDFAREDEVYDVQSS